MATWKYPITLYDKQRLAVSSKADQVLFGGSLAGGKTEMILKHMVDICTLIPGAKVLVVRKNFPQMKEIEQRLRLRIPRDVATLNKSDHVMTFKHNGAELHLGYLDSDEAAENYQGHQYVQIGYDELTHYDRSWVDRVNERLRDPERVGLMREHGLKIRMLAASNPGSRGHQWVRERFIDTGVAPGEMFSVPATDETGAPLTGENGQPIVITRQFIPSSLWDNPYLNHDEYLATLSDMDPERKRAMIYGDWSIPAGTRFPQFRERIHVIKPEEFPIPVVGTVRVVGVDYGINDPMAAVWMAKVGDTIVVYRDHVEEGLAASQQAARVRDLEDEVERVHSDVTVALDPNGWARNAAFGGVKLGPGSDEAPLGSIAHYFKEALGDRVVKGWNPRVQGWAIFDELFVEQDTGITDEDGNPVKLPRILIYDTCRELIRALQSAPRAKRDPQDIDCFVAGTMISTPNGEVPIEDICVGDYVDTPMGPQRVLRAKAEEVVPVHKVQFDNGAELVGTPDHEIVTSDGLHSIAYLPYTGEVVTKDLIEGLGTWTRRARSFTAGTPTPVRRDATTTSQANGWFRSMAGHLSTGTSTRTTSETSPRATTCTTRTTTPRTTTRRIWSSSKAESTPATITRSANESLWRLVELGAKRPRGLRRRLAVELRAVLSRRARTERARIVEALSATQPHQPSTAPRSAESVTRWPALRREGSASTTTPVPSAARTTNPPRQDETAPRPVRMSAGGPCGEAMVYALTVDGCALYYANGILVTNTNWKHDHVLDAARYGIAEILGRQYASPPTGYERMALESARSTVTGDLGSRGF